MRILYCSSAYPPQANGQAIFVQNLAEGMAALGHEVMALVPCGYDYSQADMKKGVHVVQVPAIRLTWVHPDLRVPVAWRVSIRRIFNQFQPQLIHVQDLAPLSQIVIIEARRYGLPVVITHHTGPEITAPYLRSANPYVKHLITWAVWKYLVTHLNKADQVTVPSRYSARMLADEGVKATIRTIPFGVQLDDFQPNPKLDCQAIRRLYGLDCDKTLFLYVGRIDIEKNLETILYGMVLVERADIQLAIAGHGAEETRLRRLVGELDLGSRVVFIGLIPHASLPDLLNSADIFVMPGCAEFFSIATVEAMACAKPILATKAAALPELVAHQVNGYLFNPNQPKDAARGIEYLAAKREAWGDIGASSLTKARNYSLPKMLHTTEHTYQACLQARNALNWRRTSNAAVTDGKMAIGRKIRRVFTFQRLSIIVAILAILFSTIFYDQAQAFSNLRVEDLNTLEVAEGQNLLIIAPHPDDEVLAAGGLISGSDGNRRAGRSSGSNQRRWAISVSIDCESLHRAKIDRLYRFRTAQAERSTGCLGTDWRQPGWCYLLRLSRWKAG